MGSKLQSLSLFLLISWWAFAGVSGDNIFDAAAGGAAAAANGIASVANDAAAVTSAAAHDAAAATGAAANTAAGVAADGANAVKTATSLPCAHKFLPCQPFLKSPVSPPEMCCAPLKEMISDDATCLCAIFNNDGFLKQSNVTQEEALKLPTACGANPDLSKCKAGGASNTSTNSAAGGESPKGWLISIFIFNLTVFLLFF